MIDVCWNNRPTGGDFGAHEFRCDLIGNALRETSKDRRGVIRASRRGIRYLCGASVLLFEMVSSDVVSKVCNFGPPHIFTDRDELHLWSDHALARIPQLRDRMPRRGAKRLATQPWKFHQPVALRITRIFSVDTSQVTIVLRLDFASGILFYIRSGLDPRGTQCWKAILNITIKSLIAPWTRDIINANRLIHFNRAIHALGVRKTDLPHRHTHIGMKNTGNVCSLGIRKRVAAFGLKCVNWCNHFRWVLFC